MKYFLSTECNTCHERIKVPIDEKMYERIKVTAKTNGALKSVDNFLHICSIPYPNVSEVLGILEVKCICKGV